MIMTSEQQQQQIDHGNLSRFKTNTIIYIERAIKKNPLCENQLKWSVSIWKVSRKKYVWKLTSWRIISNSSCELH